MPTSTRHVTSAVLLILITIAVGCRSTRSQSGTGQTTSPKDGLRIEHDERAGTIAVFRAAGGEAIVTQHAAADMRPYLHPIAAPDGKGVLTEFSPAHHKHQTGLYWGFTRVNGRDYFHNNQGDYWKRVSATVIEPRSKAAGESVHWQTVYDLLDADGKPVLTETQRWAMRERAGRFVLELEWRGEARTNVTIGQYDYGGVFLRMPWREGVRGEVVNAARQRNERAEGQRAMWVDVAMQVDGRDDLAHIAIFDHPDNKGYPLPWRVDGQLGVGTARARSADWTIASGQTEIIKHQFVVYTGVLNDIELTDQWAAFAGNNSPYSTIPLWNIAQAEGRAAKFLTPDEAVAQMTVVPGYTVNAWAAEPTIVQPMAFCWDDRGRLWVAENRDYESRDAGFSRAGNSRIVILEDTNHDGIADSRKVFMEGIIFPAALAVGFDGVFVGAPPNLLFVPDRDGDDKADVNDIEVRLTGWGIRDRHETLNSLHWGPDGWLYGLQGYATSSKIRKPEGKGRLYTQNEPFPDRLLDGPGVEINGGVWRYHPTKDRFEVVAHGFSNPWGIDYDSKGQLLISACVIPHLWHVIPGGIYHRQGGQHFNPYVYSDIQTIADHRHRSAHGGARLYQSDAFPAAQQGRIFMANIHEHAVLSDVLVRQGSGFTAHHGDDFMLANNAQWIGFSLEIGPDGALYVLDWHDADICGKEVLHQETGRIFRIAPKASLAEQWDGRYSDLRQMPDSRLVALQTNKSDWHARRARVILQHRAAKGTLKPETHEALRRLFKSETNGDWRLRAMWALHVTNGWTPAALTATLGDPDEHIRAWAIQLLNEDGTPPREALDKFAEMAGTDKSPVVRLYLASALQRLNPETRWSIAAPLMNHAEDANDHNLPKMIWLGVEPLVTANPSTALERASQSDIPLMSRFIARRLVDANVVEPVVATVGRATKAQSSLLEGLRDGLEGRYDLPAPANWAAVYEQLKKSESKVARLALDVAQQFGDTETAMRNLTVVRNTKAEPDVRRRALQSLATQRRPQLVGELPSLLDDPRFRVDAIRAIAAYDDDTLGRRLVEKYKTFTPSEKSEAILTLASRRRYGRLLTDAIAKGVVPKADVPVHVARQLLRVVGASFVDVWGPVEASAAEDASFAKYRTLLTDSAVNAGNVQSGKAVFQQTCGACHKMHGQGGVMGPDLTGSNRANLDYLLFNVLNPSGEVQDAYKMVLVTTRDGRTFAGTIVSETERQLTLRVVGQDTAAINKGDILGRETTSQSMMPMGLFDAMAPKDVINLVSYLRLAR